MYGMYNSAIPQQMQWNVSITRSFLLHTLTVAHSLPMRTQFEEPFVRCEYGYIIIPCHFAT